MPIAFLAKTFMSYASESCVKKYVSSLNRLLLPISLLSRIARSCNSAGFAHPGFAIALG